MFRLKAGVNRSMKKTEATVVDWQAQEGGRSGFSNQAAICNVTAWCHCFFLEISKLYTQYVQKKSLSLFVLTWTQSLSLRISPIPHLKSLQCTCSRLRSETPSPTCAASVCANLTQGTEDFLLWRKWWNIYVNRPFRDDEDDPQVALCFPKDGEIFVATRGKTFKSVQLKFLSRSWLQVFTETDNRVFHPHWLHVPPKSD